MTTIRTRVPVTLAGVGPADLVTFDGLPDGREHLACVTPHLARLQDAGHDTFEANRMLGFGDDDRDYGAAAAMLRALGMPRIRLLTNNPDKVRQLVEHGIDVAGVERTATYTTPENAGYLTAKVCQAGHHLGGTVPA